MITPPPTTIKNSSCDTLNCSCCDYDGQIYNSQYYSSPQQQTPSQHMTVNVPVVANFQVNVNTHPGYPLANANNNHHHHYHYDLSRKQSMYYQQQSPSSYYRTGYTPTIKYNQQALQQPAIPTYHQQQYSSSTQTFMENNNHFLNQDFVYGHRQHHPISYSSVNTNNQSNGHIYHQL
jgi:hypothetical protein